MNGRLRSDLKAAETEVQRIGRYELIAKVGEGASAVVWEAWDPELERTVALKVLRPAYAKRLRKEAITAARLRHPNIVGIHEVGDGFIAMEYVCGKSLAEALPAMDRDTRLAALEDVARAMGEAHRQGIVHRDLKPANVLVEGSGRVLVTDFGMAVDASLDAHAPAELCGTPPYMAPEQFTGAAIDPRADVWALGVMLYQLLADRLPFEGTSDEDLVRRITQDTPAPLAQAPAALRAVVSRGLARDPAARFPDAAAFAQALAGARSAAPPVQAKSQRRVAIALGIAALAGGLAFAMAWQGRHARTDAPAPRVVADLHAAYRRWATEEAQLDDRIARAPHDAHLRLQRARLRVIRGEYGARFARDPGGDFALADEDVSHALARAPSGSKLQEPLLGLRGRMRAVRVHRQMLGLDATPLTVDDFGAAEADLSAGIDHHNALRYRMHVRLMRAQWRARRNEDPKPDLLLVEADGALCPRTDCRVYRGDARALLGRFEEADADFAYVIEHDPGRAAWAWERRAWALHVWGQRAEAWDAIERSTRLDGARNEVWIVRGDILAALGREDEATSSYRRAVAGDPAFAAALVPRMSTRQGESDP